MSNFWPVVLLSLVFAVGCSKQERSGWYLDPTFSLQLVSFSEFYTLRTNQDPAEAVDVLQIFKANKGKDALFSVEDIRSRAWVYETPRREDIIVFFRAARNVLPGNKIHCIPPDNGVVYLILAFDRDLMRVGYLKYYPCVGQDLGALIAYGTNSADFSSDFAKIMGAIMGTELHKPERSAGGLGS